MTGSNAQTASLCPHCLQRIPANRTIENNAVYLEKSCPEHGDLPKVLIWRNSCKSYHDWNRMNPPGRLNGKEDSAYGNCPYECGICPSHKQKTCTAILEVTARCNLRCPICFAAASARSGSDPDLKQIERMLLAILEKGAACPLQLSGGEPTLRDDLPQIVALAKKAGFDHIQINTNGIRLAQDHDYGKALKDAGVTDFFLQFDGLDDEIYRRIRGTDLWKWKLRAVERCTELKIAVILVPTLVKSVNDTQIGEIIQFAKKWMPNVKGVHFQPMTYLGRYPNSPGNEDRILIPDILMAIEQQTAGELKAENFVPPG
jgi:uncharacterized radical SAM superfamily Fe-S cluster-containing enzyme